MIKKKWLSFVSRLSDIIIAYLLEREIPIYFDSSFICTEEILDSCYVEQKHDCKYWGYDND